MPERTVTQKIFESLDAPGTAAEAQAIAEIRRLAKENQQGQEILSAFAEVAGVPAGYQKGNPDAVVTGGSDIAIGPEKEAVTVFQRKRPI